jgi:hypothetical protein
VGRRQGVGTDCEFTYDASGRRWQWAGSPAADDATNRPADQFGACTKSAGTPVSRCNVVPVVERQSAYAGYKAAACDTGAGAIGHTGNKFTP